MKWFRQWRRQRLLRHRPLADDLWIAVVGDSDLLAELGPEEETRLRALATVFVREKSFVGARGLAVDDYMRVLIGAEACLPILNLGLDRYRGWHTVIVYAGSFVARHEFSDEAGLVHESVAELDGEAVPLGPVVLAWEAVAPHRRTGDEPRVVIHECAHRLDFQTGADNGLPILHRGMRLAAWTAAFEPAYRRLVWLVDTGHAPPFDAYAADSPAEFFAVMSEYFFEAPHYLAARLPSVYEQLRLFYRQDPRRRRPA